jgi:hypothetical protein
MFKHMGYYKRDYTCASLRREKIRIIGAEEIFGLPCGPMEGRRVDDAVMHLLPLGGGDTLRDGRWLGWVEWAVWFDE